ncbi:hypothetical protein D3C84_394440 [compost metagenome]
MAAALLTWPRSTSAPWALKTSMRSLGINWCSLPFKPPRSCTTSRSRLSIRRLRLSHSSTLVLPRERPSRYSWVGLVIRISAISGLPTETFFTGARVLSTRDL